MNSKLSWGIIGTGSIAQAFAHGLSTSRTGQLLAVASRAQEKADSFGRQFNVPKRYGAYEALLADPDVKAVYVGTPHPHHALWTIRAAEAGKHILCEKPIAVNHAEAMAMFQAARENRVMLMEAFMYRCHPQTAKLVELIQSKAVGEVRMIQAAFSFQAGFNPESRLFKNDLAGGGIMDVGCYPVSMSRLIAGAALGHAFAEPMDVHGSGHLGQTGVDEWAAAVLKFPGDIIAQVATGIVINQDNSLRIFGAEGLIIVSNPWVCSRSTADNTQFTVQTRADKEPRVIEIQAPATSFSLEADVMAEALAAGKLEATPPAMTADDTLGNMLTLDRWRAAIGLTYARETPARQTTPVHGRPLRLRTPNIMQYGDIPGLPQPVSRLVMGVDNQTEAPHAHVLFDDYFERGGNCFDSAYVYGGGACERMLGWWIKNRNLRNQVVILDKGAHSPDCNPLSLTRQLMESLERLQTDHVDIYMMHRDNPDIPVGEFVDVLNEHVKAGRIKVFGGSNWTTKRMDQANRYAKRKGLMGFTLLSNNFSLARMVAAVWDGCLCAADEETRKWLRKRNSILFPWSSQAHGFFTSRADLPADQQPDKELVRCWYSDDNFQRRVRAIELAQRKGVLPIHIALAYVLYQPFPTFPLIGPRSVAETASSFEALKVELTPKEVRWLNLEIDKA